MDIKKKLESLGLKSEEIEKFESSVESLINEQVETRMTDEIEKLKIKYDTVAEEYCKKMIAEGVEVAKAELVKEYDQKMETIEESVEKSLDRFIDDEIIPQVSDEVVGKIAINECLKPVVEGIKKVLEENYITIDTEGSALLGEAKKEILGLQKELNESTKAKMQLNERLEKLATHLFINEHTDGLSKSHKSRVVEMFKSKSFDEVETALPKFVDFLVESSIHNETEEQPVAVINEDTTPVADLPKVPSDERVQLTTVDIANRLI